VKDRIHILDEQKDADFWSDVKSTEEPKISDDERCKIVVVTADDNPHHELAVEEMGADDYLVKPIDVNEFHECLAKLGLIEG